MRVRVEVRVRVGSQGQGWGQGLVGGRTPRRRYIYIYPEEASDGEEWLGPLDARQGDEEGGDDLGVAEEQRRGVRQRPQGGAHVVAHLRRGLGLGLVIGLGVWLGLACRR